MEHRTIVGQVTFLLLLVFVEGAAAQDNSSGDIADLIVLLCEFCCLCGVCCADICEQEERRTECATVMTNVPYNNSNNAISGSTYYPQQQPLVYQPVQEMQVAAVTNSVPVTASAPPLSFTSSANEDKYRPATPPPGYDDCVSKGMKV